MWDLERQVSEKQSCDLAAAFRDELVGKGFQVESGSFLQDAANLHDTGHANRLPAVLLRYGLQADCRISEGIIGLKNPQPYIRLRDMVQCLDRNGKLESILLMGHTPEEYAGFWETFRLSNPDHQVFRHHQARLSSCIPCMLHADEGVTHKKKGLMILSSHVVLGLGGSRAESSNVNYAGSTYLTRILFSVVLSRLYKKKTTALDGLVKLWSDDWVDIFTNGVVTTSHGTLYLIPLGLKADWPALIKVGHLTRHYLRDAPGTENPAGVCHLCAAGQAGFPWFDIGLRSAWATNEAPRELPWTRASHLTKIPQGPCLSEFFLVDLFHTCHRGVVADFAASALAPEFNLVHILRLSYVVMLSPSGYNMLPASFQVRSF